MDRAERRPCVLWLPCVPWVGQCVHGMVYVAGVCLCAQQGVCSRLCVHTCVCTHQALGRCSIYSRWCASCCVCLCTHISVWCLCGKRPELNVWGSV